MKFLKDKMSSISSHLYEETLKPNKESYWLEVSVTKPFGCCSDTTRLNFDNIEMRNVNKTLLRH